MADIELVIKLPDTDITKDIIRAGKWEDGSLFDQVLRSAMKDAIILPKGHGRIADMDAAIKCIEDVEGEDAIWAISLIEWACAKRTIIEADSEKE